MCVVADSIVMLCISGDMLVKSIVTFPALALSDDLTYLSSPLGLASSLSTCPEAAPELDGAELVVDVVEVVETYLYRPMLRPVLGLVYAAKRLQSGRLDAYLAYMLIALVALLALVTALA